MLETRRRLRSIRIWQAPVCVGLIGVVGVVGLSAVLAGCSGGSKGSSGSGASDSVGLVATTVLAGDPTPPAAPSPSDGSSTAASVVTTPLPALPSGPKIGCLTNGSLSGAIDLKLVDSITQVNTQNVGENAPDAYYATVAGKNTIGYFVFGKKATVVVNGDGSWTGQSGGENGAITIAADGTGATVKATIEGSDVNGLRAKPLTLDLVTKCGVELPVVAVPQPVDTKQDFTEKIVEETDLSKTPS